MLNFFQHDSVASRRLCCTLECVTWFGVSRDPWAQLLQQTALSSPELPPACSLVTLPHPAAQAHSRLQVRELQDQPPRNQELFPTLLPTRVHPGAQ